MNTCDTCQYWDGENDTDEPGIHLCKLSNITLMNESASFGVVNCIVAEGGEFATGPKFGCIHHAPK